MTEAKTKARARTRRVKSRSDLRLRMLGAANGAGVRATTAAETLGYTLRAVTMTLDRLEAEGYVTRIAPGVWRITPAGVQYRDHIVEVLTCDDCGPGSISQ